jgi:RNA polymerase primary sigma factor
MASLRRILQDVTPDALAAYLADIRRTPVPTAEEELALAHRIQQGDDQALQVLVQVHLRFVVQIARKYQGNGVPLCDLINEGNLGLLYTAGKFDPTRGTRFITYAVWWIRHAIIHALARGSGAVCLPARQAEILSRLRQQFEALRQQQHDEPTAEELAVAIGMSQEEVDDLLRASRPRLSLDMPMFDDSQASLLEVLQSHALPSTEEVYVHASMLHEVEGLLGQLEPREARILREHFGFEGEPKGLAEIGRELGLSRERVRQLEARACQKLRRLARGKAPDRSLN